MTYRGSGVDFNAMDPVKCLAQNLGRETARNLRALGLREVPWSRGESCYLMQHRLTGRYFGRVHEGLGTKNIIAEAMYEIAPRSPWYHNIGISGVAVGANDMITLGCFPADITMHLGIGDTSWLRHKKRVRDLFGGWQAGCMSAGCVWSGGETPTLRDIIHPDTMELSCSLFGFPTDSESIMRPSRIRNGDAIILLPSSGVHDNGLTMCRDIAAKLPDGYGTYVHRGMTFGEALLEPTTIYAPILRKLLKAGIDIHYAVNITGHGFRKLMRAPQPFTYVLERIPEPQPIFPFIQQMGNVKTREMYGNYNMGAGFALYVRAQHADRAVSFCRARGIKALYAGPIVKSDRRRVVIEPVKVQWSGKALAIR
jgi:phosphoribosylformylglycinamidine cyclo-ligase